MDGQVQYTDARNRVWDVEKRGQRWFAGTSSEPAEVMDFNLYQLFEQIDKRSK